MAKYELRDENGRFVGTISEQYEYDRDMDLTPEQRQKMRHDAAKGEFWAFIFFLVAAIIFFIPMRNAWNDLNLGMGLFLFFPFFGFAFAAIKSLFEMIGDLF